MLAVSCRDYDEELVAPDSSKAQVVFSVAMDTPMARTRAAEDKTWGDNDDPSDPGTAKDNRIDIDQLIVKIVDGNTEYEIVDIMKWKSGDNTYKFVGVVKDVNKAITLDNAKVYVYANMGKGLEPAETFTQDAEYIPMWGVKNVRLNFVPGKRADAGQISLLRAMAKLEVKLGGEMVDEYELTGATLNKYNKVGNTHPALPDGFNGNTEDLGLEAVLNVNTSDATDLALVPTEDGSSYIVYLPEVENGTSETDWLKISVGLKEKNGTGTEEGSFFIKDYSNEDNPVAIDIIRNHWYQYTITGFAASEIQVEYNVLDWQGVEMEIGGDGFLFLNKDVIEIYNSNIDTDQLKFASSSPIKSIELKDLYTHDRDGNIVEGATDGVSAYYISKYGQKIQLGTDPGFDITDKEDALAREEVILRNIKATAEADKLNGGITIYSPFLAESSNEIDALKQNSHYDAPRYLEFLVTNEQDLTATFRVMQYPPVVITNEEGFFSYRDDFRIGKEPENYHYHNPDAFQSEFGKIRPVDNGEPTHYLNPVAPFFTLAIFYPYHEHECNADGVLLNTSCGSYVGFEELVAGLMERDYMKLFPDVSDAPGSFHREHYITDKGAHLISSDPNNKSKYYQNLGPCYYNEEKGKYYRRHYTGNSFNTFYQKFVNKVYNEYTEKSNGDIRQAGEADICAQQPDQGSWNKWIDWGTFRKYTNHRMYQIRTTVTSSEYVIGIPKYVDMNGNPTDIVDNGYTAESPSNARMVSPLFMVASQLGETNVPTNRDGYVVPVEEGMYVFSKRQCREYVEASYEDENHNGKYDKGEPVTHYHDWRLPTKAEMDLIIRYQTGSRVMDRVLTGEHYFCASKDPNNYNSSTVFSNTVPGWTDTGYYMRCVRDVKPGEKNGVVKRY